MLSAEITSEFGAACNSLRKPFRGHLSRRFLLESGSGRKLSVCGTNDCEDKAPRGQKSRDEALTGSLTSVRGGKSGTGGRSVDARAAEQ